MPDISTRYRLELDTAGLMGQLAAVEAQAGGQLAQMVHPIQSSIQQTFQAGTSSLVAAQGTVLRAATSFSTVAAGLAGALSAMGGSGFGGGAQPRNFFAPDLAAAGISRNFVGSGLRAMGFVPQRDYEYTPEESRYLYQTQFPRQLESAALGTARTGMELAGGFAGYSFGQRLGGAIGRGLFGEAGETVLGGMGAAAGARVGAQQYGLLGGAAIGSGIGGAVGSAVGNIPFLKDVPVLGSMLGVAGSVLGSLGSAAGGALGAVAGGGAQLIMDEVAKRNAIRSTIESIGMTSVLGQDSSSPLGTGFTSDESRQLQKSITGMARNDLRYGVGDYSKIMQGGAEAGAYDSANTVGRFEDVTRKLVSDVKTIQTALRKNVDESIQTMQSIIAAHGTRADVPGITAQLRTLSKTTGMSPDQLLDYGVTTPTFGATQLLGGVPEVARESGIIRSQIMEAGMRGTSMTKGQYLDELGFRSGIASLVGARGLSEGGDLDRSLVAAAGGPDRLAQGTQGAMQSWLGSGMAKMQALAGGSQGSWAATSTAAMSRLQNFSDIANFELDYALEASQMKPQDIAERMKSGAGMIAQEFGGALGDRGAQYVLFKQLKAQGYGDVQALAVMRNLDQVQSGAGALQARGVSPEALESPETSDQRRETGLGGVTHRLEKRAQNWAGGMVDKLEDEYYPAMGRIETSLERANSAPGGSTVGGMLSNLTLGLGRALKGELPTVGRAAGVVASGFQSASREFLEQIGVSPQAISDTVGRGLDWVREAASVPKDAPSTGGAFKQLTSFLGRMTGQAFDVIAGNTGAPSWASAPEVIRNRLGDEATQLSATQAVGIGGMAPEALRPSESASLGDLDKGGPSVDQEKAVREYEAALQKTNLKPEEIEKKVAKYRGELAQKQRDTEKLTAGQLIAANKEGTPESAAQRLFRVAQTSMSPAAFAMVQGLSRGGFARSREELRDTLINASGAGEKKKDGHYAFRSGLSAESRKGLERELEEIVGVTWSDHYDPSRADELVKSADSLGKAQGAASVGRALSHLDAGLGKERSGKAGEIYGQLSEAKDTRDLADRITKLSQQGSDVSSALQGTDLGTLSDFAKAPTMKDLEKKLSQSGFFNEEQIQHLTSLPSREEASREAVEEAVRQQGGGEGASGQTQEAIATLVNTMRALYDLIKH